MWISLNKPRGLIFFGNLAALRNGHGIFQLIKEDYKTLMNVDFTKKFKKFLEPQ